LNVVAMGEPQWGQNRASASQSAPQSEQATHRAEEEMLTVSEGSSQTSRNRINDASG
jgi:hypothetical protein